MSRRLPLLPVLLITVLLGFHAFWSGSAINTLSASADEPLHAIGAWYAHHRSDYRIDREDPPLWLHIIGTFLPESDVTSAYTQEDWVNSKLGSDHQLNYLYRAVYRHTPAPEQIIRHGRPVMLLIALLLGVAVAVVAWHIGGPVAAVAATAAFALDPLILGHGILVKNDVLTAIFFLLSLFSLAKLAGAHRKEKPPRTVLWLLLLSFFTACSVTSKFSGLLLVWIVLFGLFGRAFFGGTWEFLGRSLTSRAARLGAAAGSFAVMLVVIYIAIWAVYGFRFNPSPTDDHFDMNGLMARGAGTELQAKAAQLRPTEDPTPTKEEMAAWRPDRFTLAILFAHEHRLFPESFLAGLLYTYGSALYRPAYLFGQYSDIGFRSYFPLAWLVKTPLTTVALVLSSLAVLLWRKRWGTYWWILLPVGVYLGSSVMSRLNIGLRHLTPIYPFFFLGVGLLAAWTWRSVPRKVVAPASLVLLLLLAIEVIPHRARYIQFFNVAAGGERGGFGLLSDSNLDWGQDLYRLLDWQKRNPATPLYLCYFGPAVPDALGLRYTNTPGSWAQGPATRPTAPGVFAVHATQLQGTYFYADLRKDMAYWRTQTPREVLGGTIYLFDIPPGAPQ